MLKPPRPLDRAEIDALLASEAVARLATVDTRGFPHVTPLWFVWADGAFYMTSITDRPHLRRLAHNPRAGIVVDVEDPERADGQRPNRQVRAIGCAELSADEDGRWTELITLKYVHGPAANAHAKHRGSNPRTVIRLLPGTLVAVGSV